MKKMLAYPLFFTLTFTMLFSGASFSFAAEAPQEKDPAAGEVYVEDEVLVVFADEVSKKKAEKIVENTDIETTTVEEIVAPEASSSPEETPYLVTLDDKETSVEDAVEELDKDPDVAYVQPNYLYTTEEESTEETQVEDPYLGEQWNLKYMQVQEAWDYIDALEAAGKIPEDRGKVSVATLDTGIDPDHEDLQDNIDQENCVTVAGLSENESYPNYTISDLKDGHGTAVAGVLAATSYNGKGMAGVAAGNHNNIVSLMGINVFQEYETQASATTADIIKGLKYACQKGAKIINMALGHFPGAEGHDDKALEEAIDQAVTNYHVVFTATAGNKNTDSTWYPSDFESVISVMNTQQYTDAWSSDVRAAKSNYGSQKDISAPGTEVYKTLWKNNGYSGTTSGTSLAAPAVAGVAALVLYVNPNLTVDEVKTILYGTATDLYTDGKDIYTGWGNVNALEAVKAAAENNIPDLEAMENDKDGKYAKLLDTPTWKNAYDAGMEAITVEWNRVDGASRYYLYRSETESGGYDRITTITNGTTETYTDNDCVYGKTYYYKIRPYGTGADRKKVRGDESAAISAKSTTPNKLDTPMVSVQGTAYNTIKISWNKIANASEYQIYRSKTKTGGYSRLERITTGSTTSYNDTSCSFNTTYYYKIIAHGTSANGKEMRSAASSPVSTKTILPAPSFSVTSANYSTHKISWKKVSGASGYRIFRATSKNGSYKNVKTTTKASTTSWNGSGLTAGKTYYYKIRPYRTVSGKRVYGTLSQSKSCKARPKKPTFSIKKNGRNVTLTLKKNSKLNGYVIYRKKGNGKWKKVKTVTVNGKKGAKYTCRLSRGKTYSFKIKSYKKVNGKRVYSLESSVKKKKI